MSLLAELLVPELTIAAHTRLVVAFGLCALAILDRALLGRRGIHESLRDSVTTSRASVTSV